MQTRIAESRRHAAFVTPIPKPRKRKGSEQAELVYQDQGLSDEKQKYDVNAVINSVRAQVGAWRRIPDPNRWNVTPETARLLQHWRQFQPVERSISFSASGDGG